MKLFNQKGATLLELVVVAPLIVLIFVPFGLGVAHLFRTMDEVRLGTQLQQEMVDVLEMIRVGYADNDLLTNSSAGSKQDIGLIGLAGGSKIIIEPGGRRARVEGLAITQGFPYYTSYYIDRGEIFASGRYELKNISPSVIFPAGQSVDEISNRPRIQADYLIFTDVDNTSNKKTDLVDVSFTAPVRLRKKSSEESTDDDLAINKKTITFDMRVFLGNVGQ